MGLRFFTDKHLKSHGFEGLSRKREDILKADILFICGAPDRFDLPFEDLKKRTGQGRGRERAIKNCKKAAGKRSGRESGKEKQSKRRGRCGFSLKNSPIPPRNRKKGLAFSREI